MYYFSFLVKSFPYQYSAEGKIPALETWHYILPSHTILTSDHSFPIFRLNCGCQSKEKMLYFKPVILLGRRPDPRQLL